ncbi:hypothetical protein [Spirosoma endbachense]|uniref:Lipoprotein n=1 Tax=Spirosoma endbachense TaxID=2666025 RepID=A0A6P1W608_9BACT|nr:hypothetical protein [Spirosoma endbachense]QHV99156.1 hypothetical protein GJR95_30950 [Spirosoma endbachense]
MKSNQLRSLSTVGLLWLGLSAGCSPPDPCKNGECCGRGKVTFVRRVEGARAEYGGIVFAFQEVVSAAPNINQASAFTCPTQQAMITALHLKSNTMVDATGKIRLIDSTHAYPYRVWGTIYNLVEMPGFAGPNYAIRLDKVESVY